MSLKYEPIDDDDQLLVMTAGLSPHLPEYEERSVYYINSLLSNNPDVLMLNGLLESYPAVMRVLNEYGTVHITPNTSRSGVKNVTVLAPYLKLKETASISFTESVNDKFVELAPECLIDTVMYHGRLIRFYNVESISGPFFEVQRTLISSKINKDAYLTNRRLSGSDTVFVLGGNLHATNDHESIRLMLGKTSKEGCYPAAWDDVWAELQADDHRAVTERKLDVFDDSIVLPKFVSTKRKTYFMVYGDVFGKVGSPLNIDLNGMEKTDSSIPVSSTYGLTMSIYLPSDLNA
jgi:hypothetical protein